jgi:CheY-like chemotaxis protein
MNARDAVNGAGEVEVRLEALEGPPADPELAGRRWARLRVRDEGVGMDATVRERLFEPYATTKGGAGHGLGLAVVHGVVERLGGAIRIDSAPGRGAVFDVWLPLTAHAPPDRPPPAPVVEAPHRTVLVVDDQPLVRDTLARLVQSLGYVVRAASDGAEALARLREEPVDVVLSDVAMPGMSGLELGRAVRAAWPEVRVVLCTGFADALGEDEVRASGAEALLAKPLSRFRLAEVLRAACGVR